MRAPWIVALVVASLVFPGATAAGAQSDAGAPVDSAAQTDPAARSGPLADGPLPQRIDLPEAGLTASFPADWKVLPMMARRLSEFGENPEDGSPVYVWTTLFAHAGDGRWCDIDLYEDFPMSFDDHLALLKGWLYEGYLFGRTGQTTAVQLPVGEAYRIDVADEGRGRSWTMYFFEHGSDRYMLTCTDDLGSTEDWLPIAESIELLPR